MAWVPFVCVPLIVAINVVAWLCNRNSWPRRRLARGKQQQQPARLLGITNRANGSDRAQPPRTFWAWELLDPAHCVTSPVLPQWALLALRLSALPYFASFFLVKAFADQDLKPNWLTFFTNWSFVVFALSMLLGAAHSAVDMRQRKRGQHPAAADAAAASSQSDGTDSRKLLAAIADPENPAVPSQVPLQSHSGLANTLSASVEAGSSDIARYSGLGVAQHAPGGDSWSLLAKAHLLSAEIACTSELFLTAFYWGVLYSGGTDDLGSNIMVHGVNNVFMLADVALSRLPFVSYHFQAALLYGSAYLLFMWIYYAATGEWTYTTLDWNKSSSLVYYLLLPCLLALAFFLYWGLAWARERLVRRRQQRALAAAPAACAAAAAAAAVELQPGRGTVGEP